MGLECRSPERQLPVRLHHPNAQSQQIRNASLSFLFVDLPFQDIENLAQIHHRDPHRRIRLARIGQNIRYLNTAQASSTMPLAGLLT